MISRRKFIRYSTRAGLGTIALSGLPTLVRGGTSPSDVLNIGAIGINGMGWSNLQSMLRLPGTRVTALCDVDNNVLQKRLGELEAAGIPVSQIKTHTDYRHLLDDKDIDIVIAGTPDHWHALQMIHAVQAGKHVYVEKPVGNSIEECRRMVAAQKHYGRMVQAGQWQRSQQHFRDAVAMVHSGKLGNIRTVKVWAYQGWMKPGPVVPDSAPPAGVDYEKWLGPAPKRAFNSSRFHFNFRWFWDYAGGLMTDWGVHVMDYAMFGMQAGMPKSVSALGGQFAYPDLYAETPDTMTALYEFDEFNLIWEQAMGIDNGPYGRDHGIAFIGNNGTLVLARGGWEVIEEQRSEVKVALPLQKPVDNGLDKHTENFLAAIRANDAGILHCPIETGAHIATICQLGNIAFRSQEKLTWDEQKNALSNPALNEKYFEAEYHNGYVLPKIG